MGPGETRAVQVTGVIPTLGRELVPASATGVVLNVTSTNSTTGGFLTVHSTPTVPNASNVNFPAGRNVPNLVLADLENGRVNITNALGQTDVIVDVMGYFGTTGDELTPLTPARVFDNRPGAKIGSNQTVTVAIAGRPQIPAGVTAVFANVTVDASTAAGFLTVYPQAPLPNTSNVNFIAGDTVPNLVLARVNSGNGPGAHHEHVARLTTSSWTPSRPLPRAAERHSGPVGHVPAGPEGARWPSRCTTPARSGSCWTDAPMRHPTIRCCSTLRTVGSRSASSVTVSSGRPPGCMRWACARAATSRGSCRRGSSR